MVGRLWDYVKSKRTLTQPKSTDRLWQVLLDPQNNLPVKFTVEVCARVSEKW